MPRRLIGGTVLDAAVERIASVYREGHRVVVSFSGGKDSLVVLELAVMAATETGHLPVEAVLRDEELGWPDHYEYCERTAARADVDLTWIVAREPHWYAYDREQPFWWAFDPRVAPEKWVRQPPSYATYIDEITIEAINRPDRYPPDPGHELVTLIGIRAQESRNRMLGVHSMGGWLTSVHHGARKGWPIYDWSEKDVWTAISRLRWDYPHAYDRLFSVGVPKRENRMGAFMNPYASRSLRTASQAYPAWFTSRLYPRFPGFRRAMAMDPAVVITPWRPTTEPWKRTYYRENVDRAPEWIAVRAEHVATASLRRHWRHSGRNDLPDDGQGCFECGKGRGSWQQLANGMFLGDPFAETSASADCRPVEPEFFRPELAGTPAGRWGGHPG